MEEIYQLETLEELKQFIAQKTAHALRPTLLEAYARLLQYKNIEEWNQLVRICESLSLTGWGEEEPQEALASKWINGAFYTVLQNKNFEAKEGTSQSWRKQNDSYVLDGKDVDLTAYSATKLASQRNKLPKAPIRYSRSGNYQKSLQPLIDQLDTLKTLLIQETQPERYGHGFSYIGINLYFSNHDDQHHTVRHEYYHEEEDVPEELKNAQDNLPLYSIRPRLKISNLSTKEHELRLLVTRYFTKEFGFKTVQEQKQILREDFLEIIDQLAIKLQKKKIAYDTSLFKEDVERIFELWR
ncbi:hypothetical protein H4K35_05410 [Myroides sp. NP-2]|uniref:hypothetical protein n=1 Tax=Myroides sp. NP-2 TaxID=2759945 RepID=UPI0015F818FF|nr:hypothetical protein [Myroides sp. NP-2]MBB1149575.1 hypothetical protein [Myroides sp. NP-2]